MKKYERKERKNREKKREKKKERILAKINEIRKLSTQLEKSEQELRASLLKAKGKNAEDELKLRIKKIDELLRVYNNESGLNSQG
jgi:hypothetical protein